MDQLGHIARELVRGLEIAPQGACGCPVGSGRPTKTQVDAARVQRLQSTELLGDHQRRMVGQHDSARTDADAARARSHMADDDGGCGAGDARHVVVLGQPEPLVYESVGGLGEGQGLVHGATEIAAFDDRG